MIEPFKVVFMTGSTGSGKKTGAQMLAQGAPGPWVLDGFTLELKERCHAAFKIFGQDRLPAHPLAFEGELHRPHEAFGGLTPAAAYQSFTKFVTGALGPEAMGQWVVQRCNYFREIQTQRGHKCRGLIMVDEAPPASYAVVAKAFGPENCTEIFIRRVGMAGMAVNVPGTRMVEVKNCGDSMSTYENALRQAVPQLYIEVTNNIVVP